MIKDKIKKLLRDQDAFMRIIQYMYLMIINRNRLMKRESYGNENPDKCILLIRPSTEDGVQGLMSLFIQALRWIEYANLNGYIPYVDYKNYETQYHDGVNNAWDYYFTQPSSLSLEEVYKSKNVILTGASLRKTVDYHLFRSTIFSSNEECRRANNLILNNINISPEIEKIVNDENSRIHVENCAGLFIRGTDYIMLKPTGEYVQPTIEEYIKGVDKFLADYEVENLFLVTEDYSYYKKLTEHYKNRIKIVSFDSFVRGYSGKDVLSKSNVLIEDKRKRGSYYFSKIVLLSKCKYLIASITMGSIVAYSLNGGNYEGQYIFDLGLYS